MTTRFDEYVERREEERTRARNAEINRLLLEGLTTRTKEEVIARMLGELTFPIGTATILTANSHVNEGEALLF